MKTWMITFLAVAGFVLAMILANQFLTPMLIQMGF